MSEVNVERRNIIERIQKKIKSSNLKPEEIQAIDKARSQVYNQSKQFCLNHGTAEIDLICTNSFVISVHWRLCWSCWHFSDW